MINGRKLYRYFAGKLLKAFGFHVPFVFPEIPTGGRGIIIGAGKIRRDGYDTQDLYPLPGIDFVFDISKTPWPIATDSYDALVCRNVLEHIPKERLLDVLSEISRITKSGSKIIIRLPYWNSRNAHADPTHLWGADFRIMEYFDERFAKCQERSYYVGDARFQIDKILVAPLWFRADHGGNLVVWLSRILAPVFGNTIRAIHWRLTNKKVDKT